MAKLTVPIIVKWDDIEEDLAKGNIVKVIRCKDCKYYLKSDEECDLIQSRLLLFMEDKRWTEDSFCSWAKRRNDEIN